MIAQIKAVASVCRSPYCIIHRENLAIGKMSLKFYSTLREVVKIVNHVKVNALNSRLFAALCEDAGSEHTQLILHADIRWLSRGKVLSQIFKLRHELTHFL